MTVTWAGSISFVLMITDWFATSPRGPSTVSIDPDGACWSFSGLRVIELAAGGSVGFDSGEDEVFVLPLCGAAVVECEGEKAELTWRTSVFAGVTDRTLAPLTGRVQGLREWRSYRALGAATRGPAPLAPASAGWRGAFGQWRGYRRGGAATVGAR